jgi:hypothetical protein
LLHSVDALVEPHHPIFLSRLFKAGGLFKEHAFPIREDAVKESGFDIELLDVPVQRCAKV